MTRRSLYLTLTEWRSTPLAYYALLARIWAWVFLVVGLSFLALPAETGVFLTGLARSLGLRGEIKTPTDSLWWVLSLSLMSGVATLAYLCARHPEDSRPYHALLVAKWVSTLGFASLAIRVAPAWWICAWGDGFVAISIFLARHWAGPATPSLSRRWFLLAGAREEDLDKLNRMARDRRKRYAPPVRRIYPFLAWALDWFAPRLLLGIPRRARHLNDQDLDRLLQAMKRHRRPIVRMLIVFYEWPLSDALTAERPPISPPHPLEGRVHPFDGKSEEIFDEIVIGSGAGGAPVAWSLARQGHRVAILEAGGLVRSNTVADTIEKHFAGQATIGSIRGGTLIVFAGQGLGGTTAINSGTSLRPLPECLERWNELVPGENFHERLAPWLDQAERKIGVTVPPKSLLCKSSEIFERGLAAVGRDGAYVLPRNAPLCEGRARCCFGCPSGAKLSTDRAFLPEALDAGAHIFSETRATRILERPDGIEVEIEPHGTLRARRLILSAGALWTPRLIRRNRLGSRWRVAGSHLKIHPAAKVFAYFPDVEHGDRGVPQALGYRPPDLPRVTMEGVHTPRNSIGPMLQAGGSRWRWWIDRNDHLATFGLMVRDRTTGRVRHLGGRPIIDYRLHKEDALDMGHGLLLIAEAFFAAGASRVLLPLAHESNEPEDISELRRLRPEDFVASRLLTSGFHPQGTAGIGRVVDRDLKLIGSDRIWVCDASVFPDSPGVNPQVTIIALALELGDALGSTHPTESTATGRLDPDPLPAPDAELHLAGK